MSRVERQRLERNWRSALKRARRNEERARDTALKAKVAQIEADRLAKEAQTWQEAAQRNQREVEVTWATLREYYLRESNKEDV